MVPTRPDARPHPRWPPEGDAASGQRLLDRLHGTPLLDEEGAEAMLRCLGSHSPFLSDLAWRERDALRDILRDGPDAVVASTLAKLSSLPEAAPRPRVAQALRAAKRVVALAVAVADLSGAWSLDQVTGALSDLAEAALRKAVSHLLGPHADTSGFVVLAMGKLGARELNYSSDIDLVLLHDPHATSQAGGRGDGSARFTAIARDIVTLMTARDQDGYVFRTDLRLRPDPASTPLCVSVPAALAYYEAMAQTWERAAMIKARPVAGDLAAGRQFLEAIRPFVWRRNLDFSAIADLHAMKRRIDAHKGHTAVGDLAGHDVKLGRGGIREIEFIAQTMQLVWGGRDPQLRLPQTVPVLRRLSRAGLLRPRAAGELIAAYRFLRTVEHRLQMVADRQTHALPSALALPGFARFMGFTDLAAFERVLTRHLLRVQRHYADVFVGVPAEPDPVDAPMLAALGFADPESVLDRVNAWRSGQIKALRSERARTLLDRVLPSLLRALAQQKQPEVALARFDRFLARLPAGVTLLSLFDHNRALLDRLAAVLGAAAPLAEHLASTPSAIEGLLSPAGPVDPHRLLAARLADAAGLEGAIRVVQRTVREEDFAISLGTLEGRVDANAAGLQRADLADAAIGALLPAVLADIERRYGSVPGADIAVVLLGKAGGREMMAGSDLDLMLIYDHAPDVTSSVPERGEGRAIAAGQWFVRLVHGLVGALSAPDAAGALYAIDMRLRPSGNMGPVAVSLSAFGHYHQPGGQAWTWERMALTRARVAAGVGEGPAKVEAAIRAAIAASGPAASIRADAAAMRARMERETPVRGGPVSLAASKLRPGGLVDVEFIAQTLLLSTGLGPLASDGEAPERPRATRDILAWASRERALSPDDAAFLIHADYAWRTVLGMLRLVVGKDGVDPTGAALGALLRAAQDAGLDAVDDLGLRATLDTLARDVRERFVRLVGPPRESKA